MTSKYDVTDEHKLVFNARRFALEERFLKGINDPDRVLKHLQRAFENVDPSVINIRDEWEQFYKKYFQLEVNFSSVRIPVGIGFKRVAIISYEVTYGRVFEVLRKYFEVNLASLRQYSDESSDFQNKPSGGYAIRLHGEQEPDDSYLGVSMEEFIKKGINSTTLFERLICGLKYFDETGQRMDTKYRTICMGSQVTSNDSRNDSKVFPYTSWVNSALIIGECYMSASGFDKPRYRQVIR